MRIPLRGQVQVMIKNPNKTVVKVFLVPYDFMDMPAGTKTFLRQKYYSTGLGVGPVSSNPNSGGTLRYAIHLQFCSPAPGFVYLYRSIRVVFANRVPDGKESLRVVLEGLGLGSRTIGGDAGTNQAPAAPVATETGNAAHPAPKKLEERYVKMRKGEVSFCASKKKMEESMTMDMTMDGELLKTSSRGLGLGLDREYTSSHHHHHHGLYEGSSGYHRQSPLDFNGQPLQMQDHGVLMDKKTLHTGMGMNIEQSANPFRLIPSSKRARLPGPLESRMDGVTDGFKDEEGDYKSMSSSILIGHISADVSPSLSPKRGPSSSDSMTLPLSVPHFGSGVLSHKEKSRLLGM